MKNDMFGVTLRFFTMDTTAFFEMVIMYWQKSMKRKKLSEKPFADPRVIAKPVCFAEQYTLADIYEIVGVCKNQKSLQR